MQTSRSMRSSRTRSSRHPRWPVAPISSYQLGKMVSNKQVRGRQEPEEGEEAKLEVKIVEVKFSKCEKPTQSPPAQQCQTCGVYVCPPCDPTTDAAVCPVCEGSFLGVEVAAPAAVAEAID